MGWTHWSNTQFRVAVMIGTPDTDPEDPNTWPQFSVSRADVTYSLNAIPHCDLVLAIGRNVQQNRAATIHWYADDLKMMLPMQVIMEVTERANSYGPEPWHRWPDGPFVIFAGYVASTSFNLSTRSGASFGIKGIHWLSNLAFSSCLTNRTSATSAASLITPAAQTAGRDGDAHFVSSTAAIRFTTPAGLATDMWSKVLAPWLYNLSLNGPLQLTQVPPGVLAVNPLAAQNTGGQRTLLSFEPVAGNVHPYWVPMPFTPLASGLISTEPFRQGLAAHLSKEPARSFWDQIALAYAPDFKAMLVPLGGSPPGVPSPTPGSAMFVPSVPSLRGRYLTIEPSEYDGMRFEGINIRPLRAVCMLRGRSQNTGAQGNQQGQAAEAPGVGGYYENPFMPLGMTIFEQLPAWVSNITPSSAWGAFSARPNGAVGRADTPGIGLPAGVNPVFLATGGANLWDRYARAVYIDQAVKGRTGEIVGRVRFDIAPGSTIRVKCVEERFIAQERAVVIGGDNYYSLYGRVSKLTHTLDSENRQAETRIELTHVRNSAEADNPLMSSDSHPLYATVWPGAPLVNHPAFYPNFFHQSGGVVFSEFGSRDDFGP